MIEFAWMPGAMGSSARARRKRLFDAMLSRLVGGRLSLVSMNSSPPWVVRSTISLVTRAGICTSREIQLTTLKSER
jgi:hypothetical protein